VRQSVLRLLLAATASVVLLTGSSSAVADTGPQPLPFGQNWADTGLITANDDWSRVAGIEGYLGQDITTVTGTDPQTLLTSSSVANDLDVIANQTNPGITNGGVGEFELTDPVVALQGSGTADAPYLLLTLDTTGKSNVTVAYDLRDIDGSADNAVQQVALQFRVGASGNFTNVPAGYVADATTAGAATLVTAVNAVLPAAASNQPLVQVRVITTNAAGNDEWVGVDKISVTAPAIDPAPSVQSSSPANGDTGVAVDSNVSITFSEPVDASASSFVISCPSGTHTATVSGGPTTFSLNPDLDFASSETCTVNVVAANVFDQDSNDPPDTMAADYPFSFTTAAAPPRAGDVVVSEVYGGGGNANAVYTNDFIELYNRTASTINLTGWSVQYASSAGTTWAATPLSGTIPAGRNYLVQEAAGATPVQPLASPDATGTIPMSATSGKVALVSSATSLSGACPTGGSIMDFVGYGAANCFEGTGATAALTNSTSAKRNGGGATDTNSNAADFTVGTPDPHPTADQAPSVAATTPAAGASGVALDASISITFSEAVDVAAGWFTISCAASGAHGASSSGGPTTFTLDPSSNFAPNESCIVTVLAANVTDQDTDDPPNTMAANYVFSFQTADVLVCGDPATPIHDVQGSGASSPIAGTAVTVEGIVVGDYQLTSSEFGGYYVQEESSDADANPNTSEGVFVFANGFGPDVSVGDEVRVRGTVSEFNGLTEVGAVSGVSVCSTGNPITPTSVSLPVASLDVLERTEGMLVQFSQTLTATEVFNLGRFGEISLSGAGRLYTGTAVAAPGPLALAVIDQNNRSRIVLDDGNNQQNIDPTRYPQGGLSALNTLRVGDTLPGLTGVMDYRFGGYRIQPVGPISFNHTNPRTPAPAPVGGNLKVASFNVLNFFNGNGLGGGFPTARGANTQVELDRQKAKEVSALKAMNADIVGLMEIENDAPPNSAIEELVAGLNQAMGAGTYSFIDTGVIGTDEIKVALIYKPSAVTPVGAYQIITSGTDPRFIDTKNRPSLAQTFVKNSNGGKLTVVVDHLKSKGSDCNDVGDRDTGDGSGNCNITRTNAAKALVDWLATDPTGSGDRDFLLIGDFNSYTFEDPIAWITSHGFTNLVRQYGGLDAYSYVFNGESGYLDHGLASSSLAAQATGATDWHINPDEPTVLDYNTEFKTSNQVNTFYDPGPYRASDHDPVVIGLNLDGPPTVDGGGPYSVPEGGSVQVSAAGSDPDSDTLTYAWDLDNNGSFETAGQSATFSAATSDGPSAYTVKVRAIDPGGLSAVDSATVNVTNAAPTAKFNAPATAPAGFSFTLSLTDPVDPSSADTTAGFTYAFDCGDGAGYGAFAARSSRSCPTTTTGTRTVRGQIKDKDGGVTPYTATVRVAVTFASLCDLTRTLVTKADVAQSLCDKLAIAAAAAAAGDAKKRDNNLAAYRNQIDAQIGKSITSANSALLKQLSLGL
jgi:predicted extracellular nuclease